MKIFKTFQKKQFKLLFKIFLKYFKISIQGGKCGSCYWIVYDAPPSSLRDLKVGPKMKQQKNKTVEACSLICNIFGIKGRVRALKWD
jgi:hypothetical protein